VRTRDRILAGLSSLRRQKLRTTLTALGVTIGIATLVASVAVGVGVRRIVEDGFKRERRLREITVFPGTDRIEKDEFAGIPSEVLEVEGAMSDARRDRIRRKLAVDWRVQHRQAALKPLSPQQLQEFATWDHIVAVEPDLLENVRMVYHGKVANGNCSGFVGDLEKLSAVIDFGRPPTPGTNEVIVHEYQLYKWGVRSDADLQNCLGQSIKVEFFGKDSPRSELLLLLFDAEATGLTEAELKAMGRARELLPKAIEGLELSAEDKEALLRALGRKRNKDSSEKEQSTVFAEFRIAGVFRDTDQKKDGDLIDLFDDGLDGQVVLPRGSAEKLFARLPNREDRGFQRAVIIVDSDENLKEVCDRLKAEGYHFYAIGLYLQLARKNVLLIGFTMDFVALLALSVACLGIMNTMFTAVLERTKEIGVMKAVGAKDRHILAMFLAEGAMIGLIGGWLGVLIGWLVSFPGDNVALRLIREQEPNMPPPETVFRYPLWLVFGAPALAIVVTTLAGLLPARRAARVEPVIALRAE
jgi:putative ABC transport system permease protein